MNRIRELRKQKNITQEKLAMDLDVARSTIAMYETNKSEPDFDLAKRIADYFNVTVEYVFFSNDKSEMMPCKCYKNNLFKLRIKNNLKQKDIASYLNVSKSTYSYWENGTYDIDFVSLFKLSKFYDISIDYMLNNINKQQETIENLKYFCLDINSIKKLTNKDIELIKAYIQGILDSKQ